MSFCWCLIFFMMFFVLKKSGSVCPNAELMEKIENKKICGILYQNENCNGPFIIVYDQDESSTITEIKSNDINENALYQNATKRAEYFRNDGELVDEINSGVIAPYCVLRIYEKEEYDGEMHEFLSSSQSKLIPRLTTLISNHKVSSFKCVCFKNCNLKFSWKKMHECGDETTCSYLLKSGIYAKNVPIHKSFAVKIVINDKLMDVNTMFYSSNLNAFNISEEWKAVLNANKGNFLMKEINKSHNITTHNKKKYFYEQYIAKCDFVTWKSEKYRIIEENIESGEHEIIYPKNVADIKLEIKTQWGDDKEVSMIITNNEKQNICRIKIKIEEHFNSTIKNYWNLELISDNRYHLPSFIDLFPGKRYRGSGFLLNGNFPKISIINTEFCLKEKIRTGPAGFNVSFTETIREGKRKKYFLNIFNREYRNLVCGAFELKFSNDTIIETTWNMIPRYGGNDGHYILPEWLILKPGELYTETGFTLLQGELLEVKGTWHYYASEFYDEIGYCIPRGFRISASTETIMNNLTKIIFKVVNYDIKSICIGKFKIKFEDGTRVIDIWNAICNGDKSECQFLSWWSIKPLQINYDVGMIIEGRLLSVDGMEHDYCTPDHEQKLSQLNTNWMSNEEISISIKRRFKVGNRTEFNIVIKNNIDKAICFITFKITQKISFILKWNLNNENNLDVYSMPEWWTLKANAENQDAGFVVEGNEVIKNDLFEVIDFKRC